MTHQSQVPPDLKQDLLRVVDSSPADWILLNLALSTMKMGGHRYGAFLDAATTAAKLAIYSTFVEQGENIRKTGFLYHVEPKRVKAIVHEIQQALAEGQSLKVLNSKEPYYLIALPFLWQEHFPCNSSTARVRIQGLTPGERKTIEESLPATAPLARILDQVEFNELIEILHQMSQEELPQSHRMPFSDALMSHIKFRLLHSGTVLQIDSPLVDIPLYALTSASYSPKGEQERVFAMIDDVARYFSLLQAWVSEDAGVMRGVEVFDIAPQQRQQALDELDAMLRAWADKYHQDGGLPMVLQFAAGRREHD
ncbi:heterocyst differentiation control protein [Nodosilinea sp. LEGE 07088]|uniref:heterocyst differentiation control protein n=1 Tax=Nodosilinea sp. LEGE 07088 TaxID=2777968 RepID=UPI001880A037|nr:heterocyst differentiation control protein [Nodosilinea sp. LEGE 07088]MBE9137533.1 heterocyst differentiation control protein [Nodosilinea sp. LEGE 07088]